MWAKKISALLFSIFILSGTISAQRENSSSPFFFIQLTDPQFGFIDANRSFDKETELYQKAIDEVNRLNPDFVVITGDFVNNRTDSLQWGEFDRITSQIKPSISVYLSPGNHDIGNIPTQEDIDAYKVSYGDDKFSFKHKKNWFIGLNSCLIKADTPEMEQRQFIWLKKELKRANRAKNIVLFCHQPFFINEPDEPEKYFNIGVEKRIKYLELFAKYRVNSVFSGHFHKNGFGKYESMNMITTSAIGKPLGEAPSGFRIVVINKHGVSSTYYALNEIPESVNFDMYGHK